MNKTLYLNLEDDVKTVAAKVKAQKATDITLVVPKQSYLFSDSINLRLLKKQLDLYKKNIEILTLDQKGQLYAKEAGFALKFLQHRKMSMGVSDIAGTSNIRKDSPVNPAKATISKKILKSSKLEILKKPQPVPKKQILNSKKDEQISRTPQIEVSRVYKTKKNISVPVAGLPQSGLVDSSNYKSKNASSFADNVFMTPKDNRAPKAKRSYAKVIISLLILSFISGAVLNWLVLPGAQIAISSQSSLLSRDVEIIIDSNANSVDSARLTLPGTKIDQVSPQNADLEVNGKKEVGSKAEGRVVIYNLTGSSLNLKSDTTTLSVAEKTYTFKSDQRGVKPVANANNDNGATVADIVAIGSGEGFNLPAGTRIEITNKSFGSQPQKLYAKAVTQVVGGSSRFISVISGDDIAKIKENMAKQVVVSVNHKLSSQKQSLIDGSYQFDVVDFATNQAEGSEAIKFSASGNVRVQGIAFDEGLLKEMVRSRLTQTLGRDKELQDLAKDKATYKIKNMDLSTGVVQLSVHYESRSLPIFDTSDMFLNISGKSKQEAIDILSENKDVKKVDIILTPSWQSDIPRLQDKTKITINYED